ncbi:hypothetical protein UA08_02688 [Talaromyces atroroseus]|uniref:Zn(2)-C6 fungal-type domain-containing protein n=1 Tax=Talaromyces atroroseus TaxID=1441469 RepID=A0A225B3X7_TALAT|nr:hypothetical protein UA08_02688 [Talaromyces atroroseus]OKL61986.1 hypothetical protein UA08_02688 [Talaromyces atroroseus]
MQRSHRRSTKCDFKFPACTSCKVVNASCLGFDPVTRQAVPRRSLEARVAELEAQVLPFRAGSQNASYLMSMKVAQATMSVGLPSSGTYLRSQISPALFFRPSCPPFAVVRERRQDSPSMQKSPPAVHEKLQVPKRQAKHSPGNVVNLSSVPFPAIQRMILNYVDIHLPQYPCVSQSMLEDIVEKTQHEELGDTSSLLLYGTPVAPGLGHFEYFVLLIVLAISAMTLTWKADDQARAASDTFYNSAIKHLQVFKDPGEIQALQISLLLAHYAHLCPERVDNWTCIANAARIVLSLGLYMECPEGLV